VPGGARELRDGAAWRTALFGLAFLTIPVMSTLIPGAGLKLPTVVLYRLAFPTLLIWLVVQAALWRGEAIDERNRAIY
jgi:hypothetical protein